MPVLLFAVSVALTSPPFIGDTEVYAHQVEQVRGGALAGTAMWECGHILWRPFAYLLSPVFLWVVPGGMAWSEKVKIIYGLISINLICTALSVTVVFDLSRRILGRLLPTIVPVVLFIWGDAVLAYSQSGSSYCVALFFLLAGIWWQIAFRKNSAANVAVPGVLIGLAALFWLPFVLAVPAAASSRKLVPVRGACRDEVSWLTVLATIGTGGATVLAGVVSAALLAGVRSAHDFLVWFRSSQHEWGQNRQWIRAISGCSRLFIDLGSDGVLLKRFTFKDPYNPVSVLTIMRHTLWKIGLFYAFVGSIGLMALRTVDSRRALALLLLAAVPVLFAVFLFEPSSPERFLPVLPFLLIALCSAWDAPGRAAPALRGVVWLFALLLPFLNWPTFAGSLSAEGRHLQSQIADFRTHAKAGDVFVTASTYEPLFETVLNPLDPMHRNGEIRGYALVNVSSIRVSTWRSRFARFVLDTWAEGHDIWIAKSALADRPEARSLWVEGDNPAVRWKDVPQFLRALEADADTMRPDGFVRLRRSRDAVEQMERISRGLPSGRGLR